MVRITHLYKYVEDTTANWATDFNGEYTHVSSYNYNLKLNSFIVVRETGKGYWIQWGFSLKFVRKNGLNSFAFDTEAKAMDNFKAKKLKQIKILENRLAKAKGYLKLITQKIESNGN